MIKKLLTIAALFLCLGNISLTAQITLTADNFVRPVDFVDSIYRSLAFPDIMPAAGENITWDYSGLEVDELLLTTYSEADAGSDLPAAYNYTDSDLTFQGFIIPNFDYDNYDASGWYEYGRSIKGAAYSITGITGGPNDTLRFNASVTEFNNPAHNLQFPVTYQSNWSQTRAEITPFSLTVQAFGLSNTPGNMQRSLTQSRDVVGYGTLILPGENGNAAPGIDALLIKKIRVAVDSFFLGSAPAPPPLMAAFGLAQGSVSSDTSYIFYTTDFGAPVMSIDSDDDHAFYRPQAARMVTSIKEVKRINSTAFPNPVYAGQALSIQSAQLENPFAFRLIDKSGKTVHSAQISDQLSERILEIDVPQHLSAGSYIYSIYDRKGAVLTAGKVIVH